MTGSLLQMVGRGDRAVAVQLPPSIYYRLGHNAISLLSNTRHRVRFPSCGLAPPALLSASSGYSGAAASRGVAIWHWHARIFVFRGAFDCAITKNCMKEGAGLIFPGESNLTGPWLTMQCQSTFLKCGLETRTETSSGSDLRTDRPSEALAQPTRRGVFSR
jgi:hypothetical protein